MIKVKLTTRDPSTPIIRQTPGSSGIWGNCHFFVDDDTDTFDWWFVWNNLHHQESAVGPREHTVLMTGEIDTMKTYPQWYLKQFGHVISSQRFLKHPHQTYRQIYPWMIGHIGSGSGIDPKDYRKYFTPYETLAAMKPPQKTKLLSVITSYKERIPAQKTRHEFIDALKAHFGDRMDVFGAGTNYIRDKWDGIAPYQYHLALEHTHASEYITEKLPDAYLGFAFPFYYGCSNLEKYFDSDAFIAIDIHDPQGAIEKIERAIAENVYEKRQAAILKARSLILNEYNMFAVMADFCTAHTETASAPSTVTLKPDETKPLTTRVVARLRSFTILYAPVRSLYRLYRKIRHQ